MKTLISPSTRLRHRSLRAGAAVVLSLSMLSSAAVLEPIPDKLVVLTFDDSKASHYTVVRPLLKKYGFGATFFITEGFTFRTNKEDYLTWEQISQLHRDGFEIGNHTRDHMGVSKADLPKLKEQVEAINAQCAAHGIPRPSRLRTPATPSIPPASASWKSSGSGLPGAAGHRSIRTIEGNGLPMSRAAITRSCCLRRAMPARSGRWRT